MASRVGLSEREVLMKLIPSVKQLRPLINLRTEYSIRRAAYSYLPLRHRAREGSILHFCLPKTGSQFVRLVLSDPVIYQGCGKMPYPVASREDVLGMIATAGGNNIYLGMFCSRDEVEAALPGNKAFFVYRDPRKLFVSWYVSQKYSHPPNQGVLRFRKSSRGLNDADGMRLLLQDFERPAGVLRSWAVGENRGILRIAFSALTGEEKSVAWRILLDHLNIRLEQDRLDTLLRRYSRWLLEANPSPKYSFDKRAIEMIFERDVHEQWWQRFSWLYDLELFKGSLAEGVAALPQSNPN
jgi:hypothetical protein